MTEESKALILIIEDNSTIQSLLKKKFEKQGHEVLQAFTLKEARDFAPWEDVDFIVVNGQVPDTPESKKLFETDEPNTLPLIKAIRETEEFSGVIFAIPGLPENQAKMLRSGAHFACEKLEVVRKICEFLAE